MPGSADEHSLFHTFTLFCQRRNMIWILQSQPQYDIIQIIEPFMNEIQKQMKRMLRAER